MPTSPVRPVRRLAATAAALLVLAACATPGAAPQPAPVTPPTVVPSSSPEPPTPITLTFAGDVHFAGRAAALLDDPVTAIGRTAELFRAADLAMVNLETAVTERGEAEPKEFLFRTGPAAFTALEAAGIDIASLANNHVLDYGRQGLADTLSAAADSTVAVVGAGEDADAAYAPVVRDVRGTTIAVLGLSQIRELNESWRALDDRSGMASALDVERSVAAVRAARAVADVVVVLLHWGREGVACPTDAMQSLAGRLVEAGATAIVGSHSHVLLGDGWLGGAYVSYGLGNFVWWRNSSDGDDTGVLTVTVTGDRVVAATLTPAMIDSAGRPVPVTGDEAERIAADFAELRDCTGLTGPPT